MREAERKFLIQSVISVLLARLRNSGQLVQRFFDNQQVYTPKIISGDYGLAILCDGTTIELVFGCECSEDSPTV